jgi:prepilin-type N-terminal cleavage/methylation domain-containing protein
MRLIYKEIFTTRMIDGFSLIEMLVVMFIFAIGLSVVTPSFIKTYDKISIARETQKMAELIDSLKTKAFIRKKEYKIELNNYLLTILKEDINIVFKYIRFEKSEFVINANGFANISEFIYYAGSKKLALILTK